jgi:hypothetical protein
MFVFDLNSIACAKCFTESYASKDQQWIEGVPPGLLATAIPADLANLFESPSRKLSKL